MDVLKKHMVTYLINHTHSLRGAHPRPPAFINVAADQLMVFAPPCAWRARRNTYVQDLVLVLLCIRSIKVYKSEDSILYENVGRGFRKLSIQAMACRLQPLSEA
jgi:hypothetical protein